MSEVSESVTVGTIVAINDDDEIVAYGATEEIAFERAIAAGMRRHEITLAKVVERGLYV